MESIYNRLDRIARTRLPMWLWVIFLFLFFIVFPRISGQLAAYSGGNGMLDVMTSYTPEQAFAMIAAYGEAGRRLYLISLLTADLVYPLVYGSMLATILVAIGWRLFSPQSPYRYIALLPVIPMGFDYLENICIALLLLLHPGQPEGIAILAGFATRLKWITVLGVSLLTGIGFVLGVVKGFLERRKK